MRQIRLFFLFISVAILLTACKNNEIGEQKGDSKNLEYYSQSEVFLPLGSVVQVEDGTIFMISGYCKSITNKEEGHVFDYQGVYYPEGDLSDGQVYLFDKADIVEIKFVGYETDESKDFAKKLISEFRR